jgi:hypothetical protein
MEPHHEESLREAGEGERDFLGSLVRGRVQELRARGARAREIAADHASVEPALALDIGGHQLLLLAGQWLLDERTYGLALALGTGESSEDSFNRLPPPHVFPSEAFTLRRVVETGQVLNIAVEGAAIELGPALGGVELTKEAPNGADSWLLSGTLEDLPRLLHGTVEPAEPPSRQSSGLYYFGTREAVRLGDRIRVRRWFGRSYEAVVTYIPGLSKFRRSVGEDQWLWERQDGVVWSGTYAPQQLQPRKDMELVARATSGDLPKDGSTLRRPGRKG